MRFSPDGKNKRYKHTHRPNQQKNLPAARGQRGLVAFRQTKRKVFGRRSPLDGGTQLQAKSPRTVREF
jgi:hypothetical protein